MRKVTESLLAVALVIALTLSNEAFASEGESSKFNGNIHSIDVMDHSIETDAESMKQTIDDLLNDNARKHRDSRVYKMILVNDKISYKYQSMSYRLNKEFRYNSNLYMPEKSKPKRLILSQ